ncbi:hypothetical protein IFM89_004694 [Coptis chinensis]|uniref:non-specific serine/threonine protein kinase n=1 Tax=Coptis chinensis TaxID=261450 RepID=A0A835GX20_9MAGN|nr:hypothetical protein IFM89_004694 [Coptis chinensis]
MLNVPNLIAYVDALRAMAEGIEVNSNTEKPCCAKRKERYLKLKESRDFLRSALQGLQPKIIDLQNEKDNLIQARDTERARADSEKQAKEKESALRDGLEKEILNLKYELASLEGKKETRNQEDDGEVVLLRNRVSELEGEINQLGECLKEGRKEGELGKKIEGEKKKVEEACKVEEEADLKESTVRASLENEILNLKSEIASLKGSRDTTGRDEVVKVNLLQSRVTEGEAKIYRLNELLEKERQRGDLEKKKVEAEKKKAEEAWKKEKEARSKESSARVGLENEISNLKSEIASLRAECASRDQAEGGETLQIQSRVSEAEEECNQLKVLLDEERKRGDSEKKKAKAVKKKAGAWKLENEAKQKESDKMENEISLLKSEIASLQEKWVSKDHDEGGEVDLLRSRVSEVEAEINRLSELLDSERKRGDSENKRAEVEKKKASDAWKLVKSEKNKFEEERRLANIEKSCAEECRLKLNASQTEVNELRAKLASERSRIEEGHRQLETEKKIANREKKRAESERVKAEEQEKCVEQEKKKLMDEKNRSDYLSQKLEEVRQRSESLEKEMQELMSARRVEEAVTVPSDLSRIASGNVVLLEKQLKLEKKHVKHVKKMAKLEKVRNNLLEQELRRLKQDFVQFCYRLNVLDGCFSDGIEGIDASAKVSKSLRLQSSNVNNKYTGKELFSLYGKSHNELVKARYTNMEGFDHFRSTVGCSAPMSDGSGSSTKPISGISSTLESLNGGSVRNKLQNSAIYSTSTSFSDRPSVGSQENNTFFVPRPDNIVENLKQRPTIPLLSAETTKLRITENLGVVAEDSVRTQVRKDVENPCLNLINNDSTKIVCSQSGLKRKRVSDEVESIEGFGTGHKNGASQIEGKLASSNALILENNVGTAISSQSDGKLNDLDEGRHPTAPVLKDMCASSFISNKKRRASLEDILKPCSKDVDELVKNLETEATKYAGVFNHTVSQANCFLETVHSCRDETVDTGKTNPEAEECIENMTFEDIMKLLELDDAADEEKYTMAMDTPLSPSLPEIDMPDMEAFDVGDSIMAEGGVCRGVENDVANTVPPCRFDIINAETDTNKLKFNSSGSSLYSTIHHLEGPDVRFPDSLNDNAGIHIATDTVNTLTHQVSETSIEIVVTNQVPGNEVMDAPHTSSEQQVHKKLSKYFVAFPNSKDKNSISRIISAQEICISCSSIVSQKVWVVQKILVALAKEENLVCQEKACVFFSLLLQNFVAVTSVNFENSFSDDIYTCSDSFLNHIKTVMSDVEMRHILLEVIQLNSLLCVIESFLVDKRVMVYSDVSSETHFPCDTQGIRLLDGTNILLSSEPATTHKLVAGSIILASICATTGHTGFICEASYKILLTHKSDSYLMLTMLHVFAFLCGSKFFTLSSHSLIMTVVRSIVILLEIGKGSIDGSCDSYIRPLRESQPRFPRCAHCKFSEAVASVDDVSRILLEKLQHCALTVTGHQPTASVQFCVPSEMERAEQNSEHNIAFCGIGCDSPGSLNKYGWLDTSQSDSIPHHVSDILSLVELLACYMNLEYTWMPLERHLRLGQGSKNFREKALGKIILLATVGLFRREKQQRFPEQGRSDGYHSHNQSMSVASYLESWEWTRSKIIPHLVKILESSVSEKLSSAVILVIGQLGRFGIDDSGCEQLGVEQLRCRLAVLFNEKTKMNCGLLMQFSLVRALIDLLYVNFEDLVTKEDIPVAAGRRVHANLVRTWFSQLSKEQKSLSFGILQPAGKLLAFVITGFCLSRASPRSVIMLLERAIDVDSKFQSYKRHGFFVENIFVEYCCNFGNKSIFNLKKADSARFGLKMANMQRKKRSSSRLPAMEDNNKKSIMQGRFEVGKLLGVGTFAKVYVARNLSTNECVAIKILDKEKIMKGGFIAHIKREIEILRRVRHPNIVQLFEVMGSKTKIYFVMEYVKGGELFKRVSKGRLKEDLARKYFQQLVSAVGHCHARGVFHRDLKPQNLLLDENGDLKVSDFGLSCVSEQIRQDGLFHTFCGTPAYVSPEVLGRRGYDAAKVDIWSCGVILFVLMAGYLPFYDQNIITMYKKIFKGEFRSPSWFTPQLNRLLTRLLDINPSTRITILQIMENRWFKKGFKNMKFYIEDDRVCSIEDEDNNVDVDTQSETSVSESESESSEPLKRVGVPGLPRPPSLNAFDILSFSNLSGLFDEGGEESRFISGAPVSKIISKLEEIAKVVSFSVRKKDCRMNLEGLKEGVKGPLSIAAEIFELTPTLRVVEVKKKGGDSGEYVEFWNNELKPGLENLGHDDEELVLNDSVVGIDSHLPSDMYRLVSGLNMSLYLRNGRLGSEMRLFYMKTTIGISRRLATAVEKSEPESSSSFTFSSDKMKSGDDNNIFVKTREKTSVTMPMSFMTGSIVGKRFYKQVTTRESEDGNGWNVMLDYRTLKTPSKRPLKLPTLALAKAIAAEWEYQESDGIRPFMMPLMRLACTALERVPLTRLKIVEHLMKKFHQDLVFCRAPGDNVLTKGVFEKQVEKIDPILNWVESEFGFKPVVYSTFFGGKQEDGLVHAIESFLKNTNDCELAAIDAIASAAHSLVISIGMFRGRLQIEEAIELIRLEEDLQVDRWGLVEGGHDLDIADLKVQISSAAVFLGLSQKS